MLRDSGKYSPVFFYASPYPSDFIDRDVAACLEAGIDVLPRSVGGGTSPYLEGTLAGRRIRWLPRVAKELGKTAFYFVRYRQRLRAMRDMLADHDVALVVLPEDNVGYETGLLVKAAHDVGVRSLIVPYTIANALGPAEAYWDSESFQLAYGLNRLLGRLYPNWMFTHKGRRLVRLPASRALAMIWCGASPAAPWIMNSGQADMIAVESERTFEYNLCNGLEATRMELTGTLADDVLARGLQDRETVRHKVIEELGLDPAHRLIVSALPQNQLVGSGRPDCEFREYDELATFWAETLTAVEGFSTILCLHPRADPPKFAHLESENVRVVGGNTSRMIPVCDLYVAGMSSTIRWAIACGIPTINYDVYRYRYRDYDEAGVLYVDSREAFRETVADVTGDAALYAALLEQQQLCMAEWGVLDGRVKERMMSLIGRLAAQ
ncbi:hypothetical protein ACFLR0_00550 [Candidatus Bipolaricaulota bacterium]